jgi:hypothetical protein
MYTFSVVCFILSCLVIDVHFVFKYTEDSSQHDLKPLFSYVLFVSPKNLRTSCTVSYASYTALSIRVKMKPISSQCIIRLTQTLPENIVQLLTVYPN